MASDETGCVVTRGGLGRVHSQFSQRIQTYKCLAVDVCDLVAIEIAVNGNMVSICNDQLLTFFVSFSV